MIQSNVFNKDLAKVLLFSLLPLFLLPVIALLFVQHAQPRIDNHYLTAIEQQIDQDKEYSDNERQLFKTFYRDNPPSSVCEKSAPDLAKYRADFCALYSDVWQFHWFGNIALWTIWAGVLTLFSILILGAIAFLNRRAQYLSFVIGWRALTFVSALEVLVQGAILVWLSFWLTAFFARFYSLQLIVVMGLCVGFAAYYAVVGIFKRFPAVNSVDGELVNESDAPRLWATIRKLAERLNTAPPNQIIAGIDTNFFVTEAPLAVAGQTVTGRTLFVSIPLLRLLDRPEAEAVVAHELAHLRRGDAASNALLGPKLVQYDHYCNMMKSSAVTVLVFYLMRMYRVIFEFALKRDNREREFLADLTAAALVSGAAIVQSLIKIAAYASYRDQIERTLFEQKQRHSDSLGIAQFVASGLEPYANSSQFLEAMETANIPHPFDSHPSLADRMNNVGYEVDQQNYGQIISIMPVQTWAADIQTANEIEHRLWTAYEQWFAVAHERSLAYRYAPANDLELAIVVKYFPPVVFALKRKQSIQITWEGPILPGQSTALSWDSISNFMYKDGYCGDVLTIVHPGWCGMKTTKVKLPGIKKQREQFKAVLAHYWRRHQIMRLKTSDETIVSSS